MNVKGLVVYLYICIVAFMLLFFIGGTDEIIDIEEANAYSWQKYMNETEFDLLTDNLSYMEVVEIVGGAGEQIEEDTYIWQDEILLTVAYKIHFQDGQLSSKEMIEKHGYSTR